MTKIISTILIATVLLLTNAPYFQITEVRAATCDNLKAWWSMDEASGGRADSQGSNDLTDNNTVGSAAGKVSNGADFESGNTDEYFSRADTADLSITGDVSFAFWVNPETNGTSQFIYSKASTDTNISWYLHFQANDTVRVSYWSDGSTISRFDTSSAVATTTGQWIHVVVTTDISVPSTTMYINSTSVAVTDVLTAATSIQDDNSVTNIGALNDNASIVQEYDGIIDELSIYAGLLTQTDVNNLYNAGLGASFDTVCGSAGAVTPKRVPPIMWMQ
ncbi:MAG: LamG domain-containing protein [Bacteroidetes bacterium]|nr:LamG domain-containing protein [Bacteroidota bacterium]